MHACKLVHAPVGSIDPAGLHLHLHALAAAIETKKGRQSVITERERNGNKGVFVHACMV